MKNKNKIILESGLSFLVIVFSFLMWGAVKWAIDDGAVSVFIRPTIFFSLAFISFLLLLIISSHKLLIQITAGCFIFFSLFFIFDFLHLLILGVCYLILTYSIHRIRKDLSLSIKIDFYKSIRVGIMFLIFAFGISISSHYFFQARVNNFKNAVPELNVSWLVEKIAPKIISSMNQDLQGIQEEGLTVDQWILETEKENIEMLSQAGNKLGKDLILEGGRSQMKEFSGIDIRGDEKMSEVISQMVNEKISDFIITDYSDKKFPAIPFAFTIILFLTLLSIGAFLYPFWIWIAEIIFWVLRKTGLIKIVEESRYVEVIK